MKTNVTQQPATSIYAPKSRNPSSTMIIRPADGKIVALSNRIAQTLVVAAFGGSLSVFYWISSKEQKLNFIRKILTLVSDHTVARSIHDSIVSWINRVNLCGSSMSSRIPVQNKPSIPSVLMQLILSIQRRMKIWYLQIADSFLLSSWTYRSIQDVAPTSSTLVYSESEISKISANTTDAMNQINWLDTILYHRNLINSILFYWFGQHNPDTNQKQLWMISDSSKEHLEFVDEDITQRFERTLESIIRNSNHQRDLWCQNIDLYGWHGKLAVIILLDQMSRHIRRCHARRNLSMILFPLPDQNSLDKLAYSVSQQFQIDHSEEINCGMIPFPMYIFSLMPYRHASTIQDVGFVLTKIEELSTLHHCDMDNMIRRFRRASNRRMAGLQDDARRAGLSTNYDSYPIHERENTKISSGLETGNNDVSPSCADDQKFFTDEAILETLPFDADLSSASEHDVVKAIQTFLHDRGIHPLPLEEDATVIVPIIISLSGGVDSMVIAHVLTFLRDQCNYRHLYISAVHIDYGNRPESSAEASYVEYYSTKKLKLADFVMTRIDEFKRGITARDDYEKATRNIRYDLYRSAVSKCSQTSTHRTVEIGVMLGHHRGDVRENVLSNAHKGCGPLDLSGMTSVSRNDGVLIYRPLLSLEKVQVFDYAHRYGVPYFKDTTPHWSTRGKLRNKLMPLLEEIYGDGSMSNLTLLAGESDEARLLIHETVLKPFSDMVTFYPMGIIFHTKPFKAQGPYFWKLVLRDVLHSAKRGMFSDKTISSFLSRALADKVRPGWLQCRSDYAVHLLDDGRVCIFHPESFPWNKSDKYDAIGTTVPFGKQVHVGPWRIQSELIYGDLREKAIKSWEHLMQGRIEYYLEVPKTKDGVRPLVVISQFTKQTRPLAWKSTDSKIEHTLPILGNDEVGLRQLSTLSSTDGDTKEITKVTLELEI